MTLAGYYGSHVRLWVQQRFWSKFIWHFNVSWLCDYSNPHFCADFWLWTSPVSGKAWLVRDCWVADHDPGLIGFPLTLFTATQCPFHVYLAGITRPWALFDLWHLKSSNMHVIVFVWCQFSFIQALKEESSNLTCLQKSEITIRLKPT